MSDLESPNQDGGNVMISYLIRNRYDLIIMDSFSFQHSFVCFLHHFFLLSCIATFHAIYKQLTPFLLCDSLELQRHQQLQSLTPLTHILSHSHWSVHLLSSINTVVLAVIFSSQFSLILAIYCNPDLNSPHIVYQSIKRGLQCHFYIIWMLQYRIDERYGHY